MEALVCSQNWLKKYHTINLQEILEVVKYEDIIHKSFGLVIYIFVIYKMTTFYFLFFMF